MDEQRREELPAPQHARVETPGPVGYGVVQKWTEDEVADPENPPTYVFNRYSPDGELISTEGPYGSMAAAKAWVHENVSDDIRVTFEV